MSTRPANFPLEFARPAAFADPDPDTMHALATIAMTTIAIPTQPRR